MPIMDNVLSWRQAAPAVVGRNCLRVLEHRTKLSTHRRTLWCSQWTRACSSVAESTVNVGQDDEEHGYAESAGKLGRDM